VTAERARVAASERLGRLDRGAGVDGPREADGLRVRQASGVAENVRLAGLEVRSGAGRRLVVPHILRKQPTRLVA
jgi:hypothetical protein